MNNDSSAALKFLKNEIDAKMSLKKEGYYSTPFCPYRFRFSNKSNLFFGDGFILLREDVEFPSPFLFAVNSRVESLGLVNEFQIDGFEERLYGNGLDSHKANFKALFSDSRILTLLNELNLEDFFEILIGWRQLSLSSGKPDIALIRIALEAGNQFKKLSNEFNRRKDHSRKEG